MRLLFALCFVLSAYIFLSGQGVQNYWQDLPEFRSSKANDDAGIEYLHSRVLALDLNGIQKALQKAPMEFTSKAKRNQLQLTLPLPDGRFETFAIWESPIMEPGLAAEYPMIKTFAGVSLSNPTITVRLGHGLNGFHAIINNGGKTALVLPYTDGELKHYRVYWQKDVISTGLEQSAVCGFHDENPDFLFTDESLEMEEVLLQSRSLNTKDLQTYRLAISTTVEYSLANGNTMASVLSAVTTVMNKVNSIFEKEHAIRMVLIENTTKTFFFGSAGSDPFSNGSSGAMASENTGALNNAYGTSGYDIGHVFGTIPGGGVVGTAALGSVCSVNKARGASNVFSPPLFYTVVVHEMGHQFNATHTFNNCDGSNEETSTAYQPGGGSTSMDYTGTGVCGANSLQNNPDDYFHINSLERVRTFSRNAGTGQGCAQIVTVGNALPQTSIPIAGGFYIPIRTPFQLTGTATDTDGSALTYNWEQYDLGPRSTLGNPTGTAPMFRSFPPTNSATRIFPRWENIVFNNNEKGEVLPQISRVLTFRFTVRDNHPLAGAYAFSEIIFNATASAGPFEVTYPSVVGIIWEIGKAQEVTWKVANTDAPPVNSKKVNIKLSTDGGITFPITLAENTDNDGSAMVAVPNIPSSQGRIRVEAADNIFFDISNADFWMILPAEPGFLLSTTPTSSQICLPDKLSINVKTESLKEFNQPITLDVQGLPAGAKITYSSNPVVPGNSAVITVDMSGVKGSGNYALKITGTTSSTSVAQSFLDLNAVASDFSALAALAPVDGTASQNVLPAFEWKKLADALTYDIEIASSPVFRSSIIASGANLSSNQFIPSAALQENTVYYWRVRASNACGNGNFMDAASFRTVSQTCVQAATTHSAINISGVGLPRIVSTISIPQSGVISDVNVKSVKGTHTAVAHMELRLLSPQGDSIKLMPALLCSSNQFNLGFDDQSPLSNIPCPPNTGLLYKPNQPLSAFNGKNVQGNWSLITAVIHSDGEGGSFTGWTLEYCALASPKNPYLVKNDTLAVPPNETRLIYSNTLHVADDDDGPEALLFTIVTNSAQGFLTKNGVKIGTGDTYTMVDILASRIKYTNSNPSALSDYFTFSVADGKGGFLGTPRFNLKIDPNAPPSNTFDELENAGILIYPNPGWSEVNIEFSKPLSHNMALSIFSTQGKLLKNVSFEAGMKKVKLDINALPAGVYWMQFSSSEGIHTKRLLKGR